MAPLQVGTYTLTFGPTPESSVSLVIEETAHEHEALALRRPLAAAGAGGHPRLPLHFLPLSWTNRLPRSPGRE